MRSLTIALISFTLLGAGCDSTNSMIEQIKFTTEDGVEIIGDYRATAGEPKGYALFLHMMPKERGSWAGFAQDIAKQGVASLAIDLRGHGESVNFGAMKLNYKNFSDAEHQQSIKDVEAAVNWLKTDKAASDEKIVLVGASIGANLALQFVSEHRTLPGAALLSPGLDYHGVKADVAVTKLAASQHLFLAAAADDLYSFDSVKRLAAACACEVRKEEYMRGGHGTNMLASASELQPALTEWILERVSK